jgi:hypothetical protein
MSERSERIMITARSSHWRTATQLDATETERVRQ